MNELILIHPSIHPQFRIHLSQSFFEKVVKLLYLVCGCHALFSKTLKSSRLQFFSSSDNDKSQTFSTERNKFYKLNPFSPCITSHGESQGVSIMQTLTYLHTYVPDKIENSSGCLRYFLFLIFESCPILRVYLPKTVSAHPAYW